MISLVECCKTVPGEILEASDSWLNWPINIRILDFFLKCYHRHDQMLQFWCADGSSEKE